LNPRFGTVVAPDIRAKIAGRRQGAPRCHTVIGRGDRLLVETPDGRVARFIERQIEERLGLRDVPVRGEVRCG
jgi:hypothetical protein